MLLQASDGWHNSPLIGSHLSTLASDWLIACYQLWTQWRLSDPATCAGPGAQGLTCSDVTLSTSCSSAGNQELQKRDIFGTPTNTSQHIWTQNVIRDQNLKPGHLAPIVGLMYDMCLNSCKESIFLNPQFTSMRSIWIRQNYVRINGQGLNYKS